MPPGVVPLTRDQRSFSAQAWAFAVSEPAALMQSEYSWSFCWSADEEPEEEPEPDEPEAPPRPPRPPNCCRSCEKGFAPLGSGKSWDSLTSESVMSSSPSILSDDLSG